MDNYASFADEQPEKQKIIYFTDRKTTAPLFKSLSKYYKDKLVFGEVKKQNEPELLAKFGITTVPTLMALTDPNGYSGDTYDTSDMKIDQLKKFLSKYAFNRNEKV